MPKCSAMGYDMTGYDMTGYDMTGYDMTGYDMTGCTDGLHPSVAYYAPAGLGLPLHQLDDLQGFAGLKVADIDTGGKAGDVDCRAGIGNGSFHVFHAVG